MATKRRGVLSARQAAELIELGLTFQEAGKQVRKIERAVLLAAARRCKHQGLDGAAYWLRLWAKELTDGK